MAIQAVASNKTGSGGGTLRITLEHSGDGVSWLSNSGILNESIGLAGTSTFFACDRGTRPKLPFVRFRITLTGSVTAAHLKLHVVMRDPSG
jgi:hypothetical protein